MLIEIGPGKGALTKLIKDISPQFIAIEKDKEMLGFHEDLKPLPNPPLEGEGIKVPPMRGDLGGSILLCDILQVNLSNIIPNPRKTLIVGNLPYYITSPILRMFFGYGKQEYAGGIFMVQKEVAEKVKYDADKKSYLWWLLNYAYQVKLIKSVPAKAFKPAPKVTSAVIQLERGDLGGSFQKLLEFLEDFAPYSRKTLGAISTMIKKK